MFARKVSAVVLGGVLAVGALVSPWSGSASAADCVSSPVTDPMGVTVTAKPNLQVWDEIKVTFSGPISNGHCAGDSFSFQTPDGILAPDGTTVDMLDPNGNVVARMSVSGQTVTVVLTDYVETHEDVSLSGWIEAEIHAQVDPGETWNAEWDINGKVVTPIDFGDCPDCDDMPKIATKFARPDNSEIRTTITLPTSVTAGQLYTWSDTVESNQKLICPTTGFVPGFSFTKLDAWGAAVDPVRIRVPVTSCDGTTITGTLTAAAPGTAFRIFIRGTATGPGPWRDHGSVTTNDKTDPVEFEVIVREIGGEGNGTIPTPSTTTTTTTTPSGTTSVPTETTTTPTETTSVPTETTTTTAVTTTTPATTTTTTTSTPTTPGETSTPSPTTTPSKPGLPDTGAGSAGLIGLAGGSMLLAGLGLLLASRRSMAGRQH